MISLPRGARAALTSGQLLTSSSARRAQSLTSSACSMQKGPTSAWTCIRPGKGPSFSRYPASWARKCAARSSASRRKPTRVFSRSSFVPCSAKVTLTRLSDSS